MTTDPRTRARQLLTNATPGEWEVWPNCDDERLAEVVAWHDGKREFCEVVMRTTSRLADAELIAAAPGIIADLLAERDRLADENRALREQLEEAQLRSIEARNPGIDMDEVRASRAAAADRGVTDGDRNEGERT